ncbi:MAG: hypothetical protein WKF94_19580 [Solirubrobacteraceae bacterium]
MPDQPFQIERLDTLLGASRLAHETIAARHAELVQVGGADTSSRDLLAESARVAIRVLPALLADAQALANRWDEQSVLDPEATRNMLEALDDELDRASEAVRDAFGRLREVDRAMRRRLEDW